MGGYQDWCDHVDLPMRHPDVEFDEVHIRTEAKVRHPAQGYEQG